MIMICKERPEDFNPKFEVARCFCEYSGKILLLLRQKGGKWGVPGGKIENDESPPDAVKREIMEETGLEIPLNSIDYFGKVYVRYPDFDFVYHMFHAELKNNGIKISPAEHKSYKFACLSDALRMDLVMDEDECIRMFYRI